MTIRTILILFAALTLQPGRNASVQDNSALRQEEYAAYSALLNQKFIKASMKLIVIQEQTQTYIYNHQSQDEHATYVIEQLSPLFPSTLKDFLTKNTELSKLSGQFNLRIPYLILAKTRIEESFKSATAGIDSLNSAWQEFYKKHPDSSGYIVLSRVGFDAEMKQAMVYVADYCGGLCAEGRYVLMTKDQNSWKIDKELHLWIA